jgi:phosphoserine phosphatase
MWKLVDGARGDIMDYARRIGTVRAGLDALLDAGRARGAELVLASGGFDFYIEAILGARLARFDRVYCNRGTISGHGVAVEFPLRATHGCPLCAVCKGRLCGERRQAGRRVIFVGDGTSDRCAIGQADELWAVRDSKLARACAAAGAKAREFLTFDEVAAGML